MTTEQPQLATLVAIRAAHHAEATPKYDRVVFEFSGTIPLMRVEYVEELIADGSGLPVPVVGNATLLVQFTSARAHDDAQHVTAPTHMHPKLPLIKEVVGAGDFEGVVTYGVGLDRKAELRVLTLAGASRVVVDFLL